MKARRAAAVVVELSFFMAMVLIRLVLVETRRGAAVGVYPGEEAGRDVERGGGGARRGRPGAALQPVSRHLTLALEQLRYTY